MGDFIYGKKNIISWPAAYIVDIVAIIIELRYNNSVDILSDFPAPRTLLWPTQGSTRTEGTDD